MVEPPPDPSIERFLDTLWIEQGVARNTLAAYRSDLVLFARALTRDGRSLPAANAGDIQEYLAARHRAGTPRKAFSARTQARLLSALRPRVPIYAATDQPEMSRRLALVWGVVPVLADLSGDVSEAASRIGQMLVARGSIPASSVILLVSITPDLARGPSNFLKLQRV